MKILSCHRCLSFWVFWAASAVFAPTAEGMNKAELVDAIASDAGLSKADAKRALDGFVDTTSSVLKKKKGDSVQLVGFGSFSISKRAARTRRMLAQRPLRELPKKPKEIVVVGSKIFGGQVIELGGGQVHTRNDQYCNDVDDDCNGIDDDCDLVNVTFDILNEMRDDWPIEVEMKVRASIKRRSDARRDKQVTDDDSCDLPTEGLIDGIVVLQLFAADLPEVDDEVLMTFSALSPMSAFTQASPQEEEKNNMDCMALAVPFTTNTELESKKVDFVGPRTSGQLALHGQSLTTEDMEQTKDKFLREYTKVLQSLEVKADPGKVIQIVQFDLGQSPDAAGAANGFGSFSISKRAARTGRNPQTGATIKIAAKNVVRFKAGSDLSGPVN